MAAKQDSVQRIDKPFATPLVYQGKTYENLKDVPPDVPLTKDLVDTMCVKPENLGLSKNPETGQPSAPDYAGPGAAKTQNK